MTAEFLRRATPFDCGPLEDEEIGEAGRALFAMLDQEEHDAGSRWSLALRLRGCGKNPASLEGLESNFRPWLGPVWFRLRRVGKSQLGMPFS